MAPVCAVTGEPGKDAVVRMGWLASCPVHCVTNGEAGSDDAV